MMVEYARNLDEAGQLALRCQFHVLVIVDPDVSWGDLKRTLADCEWAPPQILLVGDPALAETAVDALRDGASDVLLRPFSTDGGRHHASLRPRSAGSWARPPPCRTSGR